VYVLFAILAVGVLGCEEETTVTPPDAPPQIKLAAIQGMPSDDVYDVFVDSQNRLWLATEQGVVMFENSQASSFDYEKAIDDGDAIWFTDRNGLPNLRCRAVAELNGKIFVGTWGGGLGIGDASNLLAEWEKVGTVEGLPVTRITALAADDSSLWIATVDGVFQYLDNPSLPVEDRIVDHSGDDEFGYGHPLVGPGVFTGIVVHDDDARGPEVWTSENLRSEGGVEVPGGVRVLRFPGTQYFNTESSGIPSDNVNGICYDEPRNLFWSAHATLGIASLDVDSRTWRHYTTGSGLVSNLASAVAVNTGSTPWSAGTLWVATQDGVTKMAPDGDMVNYVDGSGLPNLRTRKVVVDRNNQVWLGFVEAGAGRVLP
jgi:ligand-binding sensor domain-containing protein